MSLGANRSASPHVGGGDPRLAKEEDRAILIGCLEHETLLRLFLTPVLDQAGPLSVESSACIRDAFADADLAALITAAGAGADEGSEAAMVGAMTGLFAILSCLSTDEFQAAGPALGMGPDDYQGFKCVLDALGGPEELAALMQPDAGPPLTFFSAALNLQLSGATRWFQPLSHQHQLGRSHRLQHPRQRPRWTMVTEKQTRRPHSLPLTPRTPGRSCLGYRTPSRHVSRGKSIRVASCWWWGPQSSPRRRTERS